MTHIAGFERDQLLLLPEAVDDYVDADNPVRFIDAFVDGLGPYGGGVHPGQCEGDGASRLCAGNLLKPYIYGYLNRVPSTRRVERECHPTIAVLSILPRLPPGFH